MFESGDTMNIDITRLRSGIEKEIVVHEKYSVPKEDLEHTGVTSIDDVLIEGTITKDALDELYLDLSVEGVMVIPCAITLKPVDYPFSIEISGTLGELLEETEENKINCQNSLDILPIIWENILMEIPMRVVSEGAEDVELKGDGWRLITGREESENSELSKLKDLL